MARVQGLLRRVRKLEVGLTPVSMFTPEFLEQMQADAEAGKLSRFDILGPRGVLAALQRWQRGDFGNPGDVG